MGTGCEDELEIRGRKNVDITWDAFFLLPFGFVP